MRIYGRQYHYNMVILDLEAGGRDIRKAEIGRVERSRKRAISVMKHFDEEINDWLKHRIVSQE